MAVLRPFLAIFSPTTWISSTKLKFKWSFWGAERVWTSIASNVMAQNANGTVTNRRWFARLFSCSLLGFLFSEYLLSEKICKIYCWSMANVNFVIISLSWRTIILNMDHEMIESRHYAYLPSSEWPITEAFGLSQTFSTFALGMNHCFWTVLFK